MALELVNSGPKMDWTMDTKIYDRYLQWKYSVELIFSSALSKATPAEKSSYIRLWMGPEAMCDEREIVSRSIQVNGRWHLRNDT